ncbi:protein-L-isoaspartate O-methyltransferase [Paenactinomyces guangxiensis]|uniref:Protein-L-isoaspartate O-methyltransferase n=1 Tax=Paenactinomyces guangxiensis TaxID=1490290 RepID=A0A7W1WPG1_9BACL|nr:methyltransferase domain-containing protein [Paenactinomyces guangxiensis]MBA4493674.1 methyltransferase domain-containing protein [Paenactinomyces guangxiensis]MBH8590961.1 methyltransferase domain-containing protein [Paenactinomyces guangxiensis]
MNRLDEAFQSVERDSFVLREDGSAVMQSTASQTIKEALELLNIQEGNRVLEIGTGSGFSGALLSYLVGSNGLVVSLDIEPEMTNRARKLFKQKSITNVRFGTRDGRLGDEKNAPYDRIVTWATADHLPLSWLNQLQDQGILVAPFLCGGVANSMYVCQMKKEGDKLIGQKVISGGYILMNETPEYESYGHELAADVKDMDGSEARAWASSQWLRSEPVEKREKFLKSLASQPPEKSNFELDEKLNDFKAYLVSQQKEGLTTAFLVKERSLLGYSDQNEFALLSNSKPLMIANGERAKSILQTWYEEWLELGQVGVESMIPFMQQSDDTWVVRLTLRSNDLR